MSGRARRRAALVCALGLASCASPVEIERLPAWAERAPTRLVLLPLEAEPGRVSAAAAEWVTSRVLGELSASGRYEVISPVDVRIALERPGDPRARVVEAFAPDALVRGHVQRFEGRSRADGAAAGPARVEFRIWLEAPDGTPLWRGRYAELQRPLSEDLSAFARSWSRGFRWVSPERLATEGVRALVGELVRATQGARESQPQESLRRRAGRSALAEGT